MTFMACTYKIWEPANITINGEIPYIVNNNGDAYSLRHYGALDISGVETAAVNSIGAQTGTDYSNVCTSASHSVRTELTVEGLQSIYTVLSNNYAEMQSSLSVKYTPSELTWDLSATHDNSVFSLNYGHGTPYYITDYISYCPSKTDTFRGKIQSQLVINRRTRGTSLPKLSEPEAVAMETLREMISEADFRKYVKYGFVMVRGASGDMYQVFRDLQHTKVYRKGQLIEEVCVRIKDPNVPKTDNVIAFMTMIETDEELFKSMGNRYKMGIPYQLAA